MNDVFVVHYHNNDIDTQYLVCAKCKTIMKHIDDDFDQDGEMYECPNCIHRVISNRIYPRKEKISSSICNDEDDTFKLI